MIAHRELTDYSRTEGLRDVSLYAFDEGAYLATFASQFSDLTFADLLQELDALDGAAAAEPDNFRLAALLNYGYALARDAAYSHAGRRYLQGLGVHNALRGLYEGGKSYIDMTKESKAA